MRCDKTASGLGSVASTIGQSMALTILPKSSFRLGRILASGDTAAVLTSGLSGEVPLFVDPLECGSLSAAAFHGPAFDGAIVQAGVPITITYTAGSTAVGLRLTLAGESA